MSTWPRHFAFLDQQKAAVESLSLGMARQMEQMGLIELAVDAIETGDGESLREAITELYLQNYRELEDELQAVADHAEGTALTLVKKVIDARR